MSATDSLITRGVLEAIDANHIKHQLAAGNPLRVKLGVDPSTPHLHIGHAVPLRKLREFQDAGHTAVLIIGDYTAQIGDPTGKSETRTMLTPEQSKSNAASYLEQAYKILDPKKTEVHFQSEWFNDFTLRTVIELMASTTLNHLLSHETFQKRLDEKQPLHMHELLYPLLQGYDSVAVKADIELGGLDQKFNVLMGRVVQRAHGQPEQDVLLLPYLPGVDGQEKMSKSLYNTINLTDSPEDMYGKIMSLPDRLIVTFFELATKVPMHDIEGIKEQLADSQTNPRDIKAQLAHTLVSEYYTTEAADKAAQSFDAVFRQGATPEDMETLSLASQSYDLADLLTRRSTLVASKSELRRLIAQNGIKKNKATVHDIETLVSPEDGEEVILQVGPRRFLKITWKI